MDQRIGNIAGFIGIIIWSLVPLLVTFCAGVQIFPFLAIVCLVTFAIFPISWIVKGERVISNLRVPAGAVAVAAIGNGASRGLFWASILMMNPAEAFLLNGLWTAIAPVAGLLIAGAGMRGGHLLGVLIAATAAVALAAGPGGLTVWHGAAFASGLIWASYTALAQADHRYAGNAVAAAFLVSGLFFAVLAVVTDSSWHIDATALPFIVLAGSAGAAGSFFWDIGRRHGDERVLGKCGPLLPLLGAVWLIAFGKSALAPHIAISALLVFGAAVIVAPQARRRAVARIETIED